MELSDSSLEGQEPVIFEGIRMLGLGRGTREGLKLVNTLGKSHRGCRRGECLRASAMEISDSRLGGQEPVIFEGIRMWGLGRSTSEGLKLVGTLANLIAGAGMVSICGRTPAEKREQSRKRPSAWRSVMAISKVRAETVSGGSDCNNPFKEELPKPRR